MKDMTVSKFCIKFNACELVRRCAYKQLPLKSKAMMSDIWPILKSRQEYFLWAVSREGVFSDKDLRLIACRIVRETPLTDGRKVWDLLTDERSRNTVIAAEKFANGESTLAELEAARAAAWAAAREAAAEAAWAAAGAAAWAAAWAAQVEIIMSFGNPF